MTQESTRKFETTIRSHNPINFYKAGQLNHQKTQKHTNISNGYVTILIKDLQVDQMGFVGRLSNEVSASKNKILVGCK